MYYKYCNGWVRSLALNGVIWGWWMYVVCIVNIVIIGCCLANNVWHNLALINGI